MSTTNSQPTAPISEQERADIFLLQLQFQLRRARNVLYGDEQRRSTQELLMRLKRRIIELQNNNRS